jgi:hypothetical protein
MSGQDTELEQLRHGISCAALLERGQPAWSLDKRGSTRRALKYRRGPGEVVIVNHDGRGWWDPHSAAKGDVFDLVQFLDPGLNFGQVRQVLRPLVGIAPTFPKALRESARATSDATISERWSSRPRLRRGSRAWTYLTGERRLSSAILVAADECDAVREGHYGSAWFAHRDDAGAVTHIEVRGPDFKGSLRGGTKTLFRAAGGSTQRMRFALTEAPIDALSLAALEGIRPDTAYAATGGGMGPATEAAIETVLAAIARLPGAHLVSGTDANLAGDRFAARHAEMAAAARVAFDRLRPPEGTDWNDVLKQGRGL